MKEEAIQWLKEHTIIDDTKDGQAHAMAIRSLEAWDKVDRDLHDLGLSSAYDMPSFWCNNGKDYKVIPTKYHKGYQQAVADFEEIINKHMKEVEE